MCREKGPNEYWYIGLISKIVSFPAHACANILNINQHRQVLGKIANSVLFCQNVLENRDQMKTCKLG